jgi:hypothetical protein
MTRIRQLRDVLTVRQQEELDRSLMYKEIEVQSLMGAIHSAAGNRAGARAAQSFRFHKPKPATVSTAKAARMFPGGALYSMEEIQARAAELRGEG